MAIVAVPEPEIPDEAPTRKAVSREVIAVESTTYEPENGEMHTYLQIFTKQGLHLATIRDASLRLLNLDE